MKKIFKVVLKISLFLLIFIILWIVGVFFDLPLIPINETNYYTEKNNISLNERQIIETNDSLKIGVEIPNYFTENEHCFDFWFFIEEGEKNISVSDFSVKLKDRTGNEKKEIKSILFWDGGSNESSLDVINHKLNSDSKYLFFRKVYNTNKLENFSITLSVEYQIDNIQFKIDTLMNITKKEKITWNKFRVH